jgi:DNA-binding NarL/FixJ family response regulator
MILETQANIQVVGEAADGVEAVAATRRLRPEVVLMDIRMPNLDGLQATKQIVAAGSGSRVVILTTFDLDEYVYQALAAGASGFLLKNAPPEQLISAVCVVAAGDHLLAPSITRRVIEQFTQLPRPGGTDTLVGLTAREREVLKLVARGCPTPRSPRSWSSPTPRSRAT